MHGLFWVPTKPANLVKLVCHFDKQPIIALGAGCWNEEGLAEQNEFLRDWFPDWAPPIFDSTYRPAFIRQRIRKGDVAAADEIIQPLDQKSILFFLGGWEFAGDSLMVLSSDRNIQEVASKLAEYYSFTHWKPDTPLFAVADYPRSLVEDLAGFSRYVIFLHALFDIKNGVLIVSRSETLLQEMFEFVSSLGETGFVYDGSPESQEKRRQMAKGEPGGAYLDDIPAGFAYWED